jgi:hypothetical protein
VIFVFLVGLLLYFCVIWLAMQAARERYRSPVLWGFIAVWISVFAFIPLVILGKSKAGQRRAQEAQEHDRQHELSRLEEEEEARLRARAKISS